MLFEDENDQPTLKVRREAQDYRPIELVRRMVLRAPDLTVQEAQALARQAALRISPALVSATVTDMRACYKTIAQAGLLRRDAEERRGALEDDLIPLKRSSKGSRSRI